ncbi:hypothetical protein BASA83_004402 [Batrachochytrium salamandrivorans]|nr:hypothetical protein BASA83_004402 [Batrachochytrium salamandrivorans]
MKFNVLVVAAMVITSVNAVWHDVFTGCFGDRCDMSKAGEFRRLIQDELESVSPPELLGNDPNEPQESDPPEYDPICDPILEELTLLRRESYDIEAAFRGQMPTHFNLMKGKDADGKKINPRTLKTEQVAAYLELSNEKKATVGGFKAEYAVVMEKYRKPWKELIKNRCLTESRIWMSPDEVTKRGPFP